MCVCADKHRGSGEFVEHRGLQRDQYLLEGEAVGAMAAVLQTAGLDMGALESSLRDKVREAAHCSTDALDKVPTTQRRVHCTDICTGYSAFM